MELVRQMPTHLDFTTLYAAALALSPETLKTQGLPLSRLLALSQLLESIVLHESLQYELGDTPDWIPYRVALENSIISELGIKLGVSLLPATNQVDADESLILAAIKKAIEFVTTTELKSLYWAVQLRSGSYSAIPNITDQQNPVTARYVELARSSNDSALKNGLETSISILNDNDIGVLGLHVLVRINLHKSFWVDGGIANYYPHFSRQPLLAISANPKIEIQEWTMEALKNKRENLIKSIHPEKSKDLLARWLSPIFIACLAKANKPEDLIDEANKLRNSEAAFQYRKERDEMLANYAAGKEEELMLYELRIQDKLNNLNEILYERGIDIVHETLYSVKTPPPITLVSASKTRKQSHRKPRFSGDRAALFFGDIIRPSLGVLETADKINKVFGTPARYDTKILGFK